MKKILIFLSIFLVLTTACSKLEDLNVNTKGFTTVPAPALFNGAVRQLFNQMATFNVNQNNTELFVQHFAETTYPDESRYDMVTRPIPANHMNLLYRNVLMNLKQAATIINTKPYAVVVEAQRLNQLAIIEILSCYVWSNLVETFGDMPYTEALDYNKAQPKYDDAYTIYKDLVTRINTALATMDPTAAGLGSGYDNIYGGGAAGTPKWIKFANSLKLRMGLMLADKDPAYSVTVVNSAITGGVFVAGDKFALTYLAAAPNQNPVYTELVVSGRFDFVVTSNLVDLCNTLNDPRRVGFMWTQVAAGGYVGGAQGMSNSYGNFTHVDNSLLKPTAEVVLFDYAEVEFLLAEAAARGGYSATGAAAHYVNAITASITYWGGTAAQAATYLAQPTVDYATLIGTQPWQQVIGTQAWIAFYMRGFSAWTTWRRLDYPRLYASPKHVQDVAGIPMRYTYAVSEQTLNSASYTAAAAAIGGDNAMTRLFWDTGATNYVTLNP